MTIRGAAAWERALHEEPSKPALPRVWSAQELVSTRFAPRTYFVAGILPVGLTLLVAPSKVGKSFLAGGVASAIAWGGRALGYMHTRKADVLYLDLEQDADLAQERWRRIWSGEAQPPNMHIAFSWPRMPQGLQLLGDFLTEHPETRVIVIDVLTAFWPLDSPHGRTANAYHVEYETIASLRSWAMARKVALVVVHHTNRTRAEDPLDRISGTNAMGGAPGAIWILSRERKAKRGKLYITGRNVAEQEYELEWWPQAQGWCLSEPPDEDEMPR